MLEYGSRADWSATSNSRATPLSRWRPSRATSRTSPVALISGLSADALRWRPMNSVLGGGWRRRVAGLGRGRRRRRRARLRPRRRRPLEARRDRRWNRRRGAGAGRARGSRSATGGAQGLEPAAQRLERGGEAVGAGLTGAGGRDDGRAGGAGAGFDRIEPGAKRAEPSADRVGGGLPGHLGQGDGRGCPATMRRGGRPCEHGRA